MKFSGRLLLLTLVILPFWGTLYYEYGFLDDYMLKAQAVDGRFVWPNNVFFNDWRPGYGLLLHPLLLIGTTVKSLWVCRLFGVVGILLFGWLVQTHLRRLGVHPLTATGWALVASLQPAMGVYAFWSIACPISWAMLFGYASGMVLALFPKRPVLAIGGGLGFGLIAILTYQMSGGMLLLAYLTSVLLRQPSPQKAGFPWHRWIEGLLAPAVLSAIFVSYLASFRLLVALGWMDATRAERGSIGTDWSSSFHRIHDFFFPVSLQSWTGLFGGMTASVGTIVGLILVIFGLGSLFRGKPQSILPWVLGWFGGIILVVLPLFAEGAMWAHYRVTAALTLLLFLPLLHFARSDASERAQKISRTVWISAGIVSAIAMHHAVSLHRAPELAEEWEQLRTAVREQAPEPTAYLTVIPFGYPFPRTATYKLEGEYILRSTRSAWALNGMLLFAWADLKGCARWNKLSPRDLRTEIKLIQRLKPNEFLPAPWLLLRPGDTPEDYAGHATPVGTAKSDEFFGEVVQLGALRSWSDTFGLIHGIPGGWYHLGKFGWICCLQPTDRGFWAWNTRFGSVEWIRDEKVWFDQEGNILDLSLATDSPAGRFCASPHD